MGIESGGSERYEGIQQQDSQDSVEDKEGHENLSAQQTDVLIFDAPFHTDPKLSDQTLDDSGMQKEIPRGALSVATLLERRGFKASVVPMDAFLGQEFVNGQDEIDGIKKENFPTTSQESTDQLQNNVTKEAFFITKMRETVHKLIEEKNPKVISFSYMFSPTERSVEAMARYVKKAFPDKLVVIGGNAATFDENTRKRLLNPDDAGADAIINYEGEWTMLDLMEALHKNEDGGSKVNMSRIDGLSYWNEGEIASTRRRERGNPVKIGPLNYDKVVLPEGVNIGDFNHNVLFARGCLGRCAFCTSREMYRGVITEIGIASFKKELEYVVEAVDKREGEEKNIGILDDDLLLEIWYDANGNITSKGEDAVEKKTVFEIIAPTLKEIHQKYPQINFIAQARVGHLRGEENREIDKKQNPKANTLVENPAKLLADMKESGINFMLLGIESGSQEILDASHKDTKVEWVAPACQQLKEAGIGVGAFWIIGLPGATREREEQSLAFLKDLVDREMVDELEAHVFVPLPGTSARRSKTMQFDPDIDEKSQSALFDGQVTYEHVDESGNVTLSKEEIQNLYQRTKELVTVLQNRKREKGGINVVKQ